jgi:phosphoserine phosphatase
VKDIKLICFDLDQTLIVKNSWYELSLAMGVTHDEDQNMYAQFKAGEITYEEWNNKVIELYMRHTDATKEGITEVLSKYEYAAGAKETVTYFIDKGFEVVLISGSIDILVQMVAKELGIKYAKASNAFVFDKNGRLAGCHTGGDDTFAKLRHLEAFCELLNIPIEQCACIGDGANDIEMFRKTKHGITFKGSDIENEAWKVVDGLNSVRALFS